MFDRYDDQIRDWLAAIEGQKRGAYSPARLARSIRRTAADVERVRNSLRHSNLASFLRHAANALDASERDGARYILTTALALRDFSFRAPDFAFKGPDLVLQDNDTPGLAR